VSSAAESASSYPEFVFFGRSELSDFFFLAALALLAFVFYLAPWAPLYISAFAAVAVLTWLRLDLSLALVVLFAPFFMLPKHFGSREFYPSEVFILLDVVVAALWFAHANWRKRLDLSRLLRSPFVAPAALLLIAGGISTVLAADRHDALRAYREVLLEPAAFFALLVLVERRLSLWRLLFVSLITTGVIVAAVGIYQFATGHGLSVTPGTSLKRIPSVYGSADNVGLLFDRVLPVWLAGFTIYLLARWSEAGRIVRSTAETAADRVTRVLRTLPADLGLPGGVALLVGALLFIALVLTYSRGAWVAVALAALFLLVLLFRWGRWLALACFVVALFALAVKGPSIARTLNSGHAGTTHQRINVWHSALTMLKHKPIFGIGPDNFLHYYAPTRKENRWQRECAPGLGYIQPDAGSEPCLSHPHNEFLDFWLSTGILGLIAFIWLEIVFWQICLRSWRANLPAKALTLGAMSAMFAALIHGLVDNSYFLPDLSIIFWLLCGFAAFVYASQSSRHPQGAHDSARDGLAR